jgi:hypothetical protein
LLRQGTLFLQFVRSAFGRGKITSSDAEFRAATAIG